MLRLPRLANAGHSRAHTIVSAPASLASLAVGYCAILPDVKQRGFSCLDVPSCLSRVVSFFSKLIEAFDLTVLLIVSPTHD